jgi:hypothetical protein
MSNDVQFVDVKSMVNEIQHGIGEKARQLQKSESSFNVETLSNFR